MIKKVIAVMVAVSLVAVLFNINVYADNRSFEIKYIQLVYDYANGDISFDEFCSLSTQYVEEFGSDLMDMSGLTLALEIEDKIRDTVVKFGEGACDVIGDWLDDVFGNYEEDETTSTTDLLGYGAMLERKNVIGSNGDKMYAEYIELRLRDDGGYDIYVPGPRRVITEYYGGSDKIVTGGYSIAYDPEKHKLYGDIRYEDGSEAPSDDEFETNSILKLDDLSDSELDELLEDVLEELERQTPDLSNIEGLLEAIYYQVCGINDKMITYDQCNALIMSLISSNDENAQDIIKALFEIRDTLKENDGTSEDENPDDETTSDDETTGDDETGKHPAHICGTLYNVKPLDKNWLNKLMTDKTELKVEYQGSNYYLESCGCLLLDDKYYSVDMNYDNYMSIDYDFNNENITIDNSKYVDVDFKNYNTMWANLSTSQKNKINSVIELIYKMIEQSVPYSMVTTTLQAFQLVVFNTATPEDIVLTINSTNVLGQEIDGFEVTLLSTSFFQNSSVSSAIKIIKSFLTVVIGYAWLLAMRKKVTAMLG